MIGGISLARLRRLATLVTYDARTERFEALLPEGRVDDWDIIAFEELGFCPVVSKIAWSRRVAQADLAGVCARLSARTPWPLVCDLGPVFTSAADPWPVHLSEIPRWWRGFFVVGVRGTTRRIVFDEHVSEADIRGVYDAEYAIHGIREFERTE